MKIHKLPIVVAVAAAFWIVISTIRYYFLYHDLSFWIVCIAVGIGMLCASYGYNWMKNIDEQFKDMQKKVDGAVTWFVKEELKSDE